MRIRIGDTYNIKLQHTAAKEHFKVLKVVVESIEKVSWGLKVSYSGVHQEEAGYCSIGKFLHSIVDEPETYLYTKQKKEPLRKSTVVFVGIKDTYNIEDLKKIKLIFYD